MSVRKFSGYRDVDDQIVYEGCKVELMDGDVIHNAKVRKVGEDLFIVPGIKSRNSGDLIEDYVENEIFQGRVTEYPNIPPPYMY